jgi:hypothetical protein
MQSLCQAFAVTQIQKLLIHPLRHDPIHPLPKLDEHAQKSPEEPPRQRRSGGEVHAEEIFELRMQFGEDRC